MNAILQSDIPYDPLRLPGLPGVQPLGDAPWLLRDEAYAGQMRLRRDLLRNRAAQVVALDESARPAAQELLEVVLETLQDLPGYARRGEAMLCPDGQRVAVAGDTPLGTLGALVQEDLCLLQKIGDEHVLTGAVLCFPASWTLSEKFMRPLLRIHAPVAPYDVTMARRVQRLFDGVQPGRSMWRANALWYDAPDLHSPRSESAPARVPQSARPGYLRSERQCILRLPRSGAVVFSIHTYMMARARVHALFGPVPEVTQDAPA